MGIFGIFSKQDREFVTFETGIPSGPDTMAQCPTHGQMDIL